MFSRLLLPFLAWLTLSGSLLPLRAATPVEIGGQQHVALREIAARFGLSAEWRTTDKDLVLTGRSARIEFRTGSREARINGVRVFLGEPTAMHRRQLYVSLVDFERTLLPLLAPEAHLPPRPVRVVAIDAGHGGRDTGTRSAALRLDEKRLTLEVAQRLQRVLELQGFEVVMTRSDDRYVSLAERAERANAARADLFVSVHFNAVDNPAVHGAETYILTPRTHRSTGQGAASAGDSAGHRGNEYDHWNMLLGYLTHRQLLRDLDTFDRGLKRARFLVLREIDCPGLLVEAGYLSNHAEAARIASDEYQNNLVRSLAIAINRYRQATERLSGGR